MSFSPLHSCLLLALACSSSGASVAETRGMSDSDVHIRNFAVEPASIPNGSTFDVRWSVDHATMPDMVYTYGLYLTSLEGLDRAQPVDELPELFWRGDLGGDPGRISCTRSGANALSCEPFGALDPFEVPEGLTGELMFVFEACSSYVLGGNSACDLRLSPAVFP